MSSTIFCKKFKKDLPKMNIPPMPGPRGIELMHSVSQLAWDEWKSKQTMLINEKHLDLSIKENRKWLNEQMLLFLNNKKYEKPSGFVKPD